MARADRKPGAAFSTGSDASSSVRYKPRIALLPGKPVRGASVFVEVLDFLREGGADVAVHLPHSADDPAPPWLLDASLVVHRGLKSFALAALAPIEEAGTRCCNPVRSTMVSHDRAAVCRLLAGAGLPVPATVEVAGWTAVLETAAGR
ncbi:MAG: hypothetical protein ACRDSJ_09670 [Rubrobacteraceae bacterium]